MAERGTQDGGEDHRAVLGFCVAAAALLLAPLFVLLRQAEPHVIEQGPEPFLGVAQAVDAYWARDFAAQFPDAPEAYRTPRVVFARGPGPRDGLIGEYAGYYAEDAEVMRIRLEGPEHFVFLVIGHEFGHHVQKLSGLDRERDRLLATTWSDERRRRIGVRYELQAECLAGVWAANAARSGGPLPPQVALRWWRYILFGADTETHGSAQQRARWLLVGYESGAASACDTFGVAWSAL